MYSPSSRAPVFGSSRAKNAPPSPSYHSDVANSKLMYSPDPLDSYHSTSMFIKGDGAADAMCDYTEQFAVKGLSLVSMVRIVKKFPW